MDVLRNFSGVEQHREFQGSCNAEESQLNLAPRFTTFRNIPPERVGLNGEYDHSGLAKRVSLRFRQSFEARDIENLRITQRGAVVVLLGKVSNRRLLTQMISIALGTSGTVDVEINGISVVQSFKPGFRVNLDGSNFESTAVLAIATPIKLSMPAKLCNNSPTSAQSANLNRLNNFKL